MSRAALQPRFGRRGACCWLLRRPPAWAQIDILTRQAVQRLGAGLAERRPDRNRW